MPSTIFVAQYCHSYLPQTVRSLWRIGFDFASICGVLALIWPELTNLRGQLPLVVAEQAQQCWRTIRSLSTGCPLSQYGMSAISVLDVRYLTTAVSVLDIAARTLPQYWISPPILPQYASQNSSSAQQHGITTHHIT
eukprot:2569495-Rhodomonas_salina.2